MQFTESIDTEMQREKCAFSRGEAREKINEKDIIINNKFWFILIMDWSRTHIPLYSRWEVLGEVNRSIVFNFRAIEWKLLRLSSELLVICSIFRSLAAFWTWKIYFGAWNMDERINWTMSNYTPTLPRYTLKLLFGVKPNGKSWHTKPTFF